MPGVVILGGGSTGEHFCAALRRLEPDVPARELLPAHRNIN